MRRARLFPASQNPRREVVIATVWRWRLDQRVAGVISCGVIIFRVRIQGKALGEVCVVAARAFLMFLATLSAIFPAAVPKSELTFPAARTC